jgi:selenocysteine lyase/cysteine desulfurase
MAEPFSALRGLFPSLRDKTYLIAHSFGPCPREAFDDLDAYRETLLRRPALFGDWLARLEEMYGLIERLLGAEPGHVALRESASACHATILASLEPENGRNRLVTTSMHFPSIGYMTAAQSGRGMKVDVVPATDGVDLDASAISARLDKDVLAVLVPVVASFNGSLLDVRQVLEAAFEVGAIPVLDAYTALGVVELDVSRLPPCVLIGGTMKWLGGGGTGLAFMYVHPALIDRLVPRYPAWLGDARFLEFQPDFVPAIGARRYQVGTPAMEPVYTARAGLRFVLEHGTSRLALRNRELLQVLALRAKSHGLKLLSSEDADRRAGIIALEVDDAKQRVARLKAEGIEIDTRGERSVRLGPHCCLSHEECERAVDLLAVSM